MDKKQDIVPKNTNIILYAIAGTGVSVGVHFYNETFWLTQKAMAELFNVQIPIISKHISNIIKSNELDSNSTISKIEIVQNEGERSITREITLYNLDMIIAVGYRVNSKQATNFRRWATQTLKEYILKGFVLNDEMLKNGRPFGQDYFDELLERIREIRASERRFYQKITDIYAHCSYDYDTNNPITKKFYKTVQNKLLFAVTGFTAAEIIGKRAKADNLNMGLTSWKGAPDDKILKSDIKISKNYLTEKELKNLSQIVDMYLSYAENQAERNKIMSMEDWIEKLNAFLQFNEYEILKHHGKISNEVAEALAIKEYEQFKIIQDQNYISDFDKMAKRAINKKKKGEKKC